MLPHPLILLASVPVSAQDIQRFVSERAGASYETASIIMNVVNSILGFFGLEHDQTLVTFLYASVVLVVSLVVGWIAQWLIFKLVNWIASHWSSGVYQCLSSVRFFQKLCRMIPALVFLILIQFTLSAHNSLASTLTKITLVYVTFVSAVAFSALVKAVWLYVDARDNKRELPLNGLMELVRGVVWIVAIIVMVCVIIDKSPAALLTGLGAFAAVLMLIFKDSILGVVAGVQLSQNDSLHVGDWVAAGSANGTVQEVSIIAVKNLNWDKSISMVPPYSLISNGFVNFNYRHTQRPDTRRVCRSYMIDADSVLPTTPQMLSNFRSIPLMEKWIDKKIEQRDAGRVADVKNPEGLADGTIDTNLGVFRAYLKMWLDQNPQISHDSDCFVTTLPQTASGIPLQVYCFTTSDWFPYEGIVSGIFEQIAAMMTRFQLYTFENPSGRDTVTSGYVSPGADIDDVFGIPYPFFQSPDAPDGPAATRVGPKKPVGVAAQQTAPK